MKILIVTSVLLVASVGWFFQGRRIEETRREIEELKSELPEERMDGSALRPGPDQDGEPAKSGRRPAPSPEGAVTRASFAKQRSTDSDELMVQELLEDLGLGEGRRKRLRPALRTYVAAERLATEALLDEASDYLGGDGDSVAFARALRKRGGPGDGEEAIRADLKGSQLGVFETFAAGQRRNLLQLLADKEFDAWRSLDLNLGAEAEQAAYSILFEQWERRLAQPLEEGFSARELELRLSEERNETLQRFAEIVTEDELSMMRTAMEAGHSMLVRAQEKREE